MFKWTNLSLADTFKDACKRNQVTQASALVALVEHVLSGEPEDVIDDILSGCDKAKPKGRKVDPVKSAERLSKKVTPEVLQALQALLDNRIIKG